MRLADALVAGARGVVVWAMARVMKYPKLAGPIVQQLRRFPGLYNVLFEIMRKGSSNSSGKRLLAPDLTPGTAEVLNTLQSELARTKHSEC